MQAAKPGKDIDFSSEKPTSSRFPPRGQDMSDAGGSHIMRTKRRGKTIRTIGFPRVNVNRKRHGWSISTGVAPEARPKGTLFDGSRPEGTSALSLR